MVAPRFRGGLPGRRWLLVAMTGLVLIFGPSVTARGQRTFNVRSYRAKGDGRTLDTAAIQAAVDACSRAGGGHVLFPAGRYLSGTIDLRSKVALWLEAGATLVGTSDLNAYHHPTVPSFMPEAKWGNWHRALLIGENVEDVTIAGSGVIDGNKVFDATGEENMRGPHALLLVGCRRVTVRDVTFLDAANYAVYAAASDDLDFRSVQFVGGWDGIHWRGAPDRWCNNVRIIGCRFFTGDDAIAGRYWNNTLISDCVINSSCNGIRLIGPATRLTIAHNVFRGPGEQPHRTSGTRRRTNMLSGIILQPGAWDETRGKLDDVFIADNVMQNVASPISVWIKGSNTAGRIVVSGLEAMGVYNAAISVESWADQPIAAFVLRNVHVEYTGGGKAWPEGEAVKSPGADSRPLPAWGFYARRVEALTLEDVRLSLAAEDLRPAVMVEQIKSLTLDNVRHTRVDAVRTPIVTKDVSKEVRVEAEALGAATGDSPRSVTPADPL